jgi:hypothetical protein
MKRPTGLHLAWTLTAVSFFLLMIQLRGPVSRSGGTGWGETAKPQPFQERRWVCPKCENV